MTVTLTFDADDFEVAQWRDKGPGDGFDPEIGLALTVHFVINGLDLFAFELRPRERSVLVVDERGTASARKPIVDTPTLALPLANIVFIGRDVFRRAVADGHAEWSIAGGGLITLDRRNGDVAATATIGGGVHRTGSAPAYEFEQAFQEFERQVRELIARDLPGWLDDPWIRDELGRSL